MGYRCLRECRGIVFVKSAVVMVLLCSFADADTNLLCTDDYCSDYIDANSCPVLPDVCNGSTSVAKYFPSITTCNCCKTCLIYLGEDETCAQGIVGAPTTQYMCGPGLTCSQVSGEDRSTCRPMNTECLKLQKTYDDRRASGQLKMTEVRPKCDARGKFTPAHCIQGSICYCVSPTGQRIFGEQVYTSASLLNNMTCDCSLATWTAQQLFDQHVSTTRCLENGSYDPLQCIGEKCLCVNSTASPIDDKTVHSLFISNDTLSCFDPQRHTEGLFDGVCEQARNKALDRQQLLLQMEDVVVVGMDVPHCTPDGKYHRLQTLAHRKVCVDPDGNQLEDFALDVDSPDAMDMNCNCARTRWVLRKASFVELPSCTPNGNFRPKQCQSGKCFCVDGNGDQQNKEVDAGQAGTLTCS